MSEPEWRAANRANWDERVPVHLGPLGHDLSDLRSGNGKLNAIEEVELPPVAGKRCLHLQCHFGHDTLVLAQRGAEVVGLDFSAPAITAAERLAEELGLAWRARFIHADLYDAPSAIPLPHEFDLVYVTWGAICWLPDIRRWAQIVAHFIKPGGLLYLAETHPVALVFDDRARLPDGSPGCYVPYFLQGAFIDYDGRDYVDPTAVLTNIRQYTFMHTLADVVTSLIDAGLTLDWLHEHDSISWRMFEKLVKDATGLYRWPNQPWLPLAFSLRATRSDAAQ